MKVKLTPNEVEYLFNLVDSECTRMVADIALSGRRIEDLPVSGAQMQGMEELRDKLREAMAKYLIKVMEKHNGQEQAEQA